ncbi:hypothetical protein [Rosettibacter firmus]|uniref:hypothetical protein n=1 Tax=Rosettibacter firmus TaxID=3111522 RepID=UPI00336C2726
MNKAVIPNDFDLPKPTTEQIKKAIEHSGYLLEQRICPIIERHGFLTTPNEQYQDQDTGKSREIDVHAIKLNSLYRNEFTDIFETILLIECKNNQTPVVFFTQENPIPELVFGYIDLDGYPDGIYEKESESEGVTSIEDYFHFEKFHHYFKVKWIARQFCQMRPRIIAKGNRNQKIEWEVSHEGLYESIEGLIKATDFYSSELKRSIVLEEDTKDFIHLGIVYPILLFSGQIFECRVKGRNYRIYERKHLTFYKEIQSKTLQGTYHIDVVQENYLSRFLSIVNEENDKIVNRLKRKRDLLKANVERNFEEEKKNTDTSANNR